MEKHFVNYGSYSNDINVLLIDLQGWINVVRVIATNYKKQNDRVLKQDAYTHNMFEQLLISGYA